MAVEKTKHQFVDDNPYLVYSGELDTSVDSAGDGGGDGGNEDVFIFNVNASNWKQPTFNQEDISALIAAMEQGKPVIVRETKDTGETDYSINYQQLEYGSTVTWSFNWEHMLNGVTATYQNQSVGEGIVIYYYSFDTVSMNVSVGQVYFYKATDIGNASNFDF